MISFEVIRGNVFSTPTITGLIHIVKFKYYVTKSIVKNIDLNYFKAFQNNQLKLEKSKKFYVFRKRFNKNNCLNLRICK